MLIAQDFGAMSEHLLILVLGENAPSSNDWYGYSFRSPVTSSHTFSMKRHILEGRQDEYQ